MSANSTVHPLARSAFSKSGSSGLYDRARPSYPAQAISTIISLLPPAPARANIVELGSGTGIFTRALIDGLKKEGRTADVNSVEPAEGMREGFTKAVIEAKGFGEQETGVRVRTTEGEFGDVKEVESASADLVVVAQAFHWIGHEPDPPLREISRVLKPGGSLALIWNLEDRDAAPWVAQIRDAYEVYEADTPQYRHMYWRSIFTSPLYAPSFQPPVERSWHRAISATNASVQERVLSKSYITDLEPGKQEQVRRDVEKVLEKAEGRVWISEQEGTFEYPYRTDLCVIKRK